ncbi:MAG: biotin--[acetyl-CoA-carboxylase] ligase [Propionibacteriaceae bacterium]|nr:biotin--[acetyl-CoA-carboxylase] ligase [Propionibacteriaceae bacterium]
MNTLPVDSVELARLLGEGSIWRPIEVVESTGSTNDDLARRPDAPEGLVRIAGHQSAGRGRFDRIWQDVPGAGAAVSLVLRPTRDVDQWGWLSLLMGMAVADGLCDVGQQAGCDPHRVTLKWPNDVLIDGAKVCGILAQSDGEMAVLGWGLNIAMARDELPVPTATSLALSGWPIDATAAVASVLQKMQDYYTLWESGCDLQADYLKLSSTIGRRVRVERPDGVIEGDARGLDATGALLVDVGQSLVPVDAGDVIHLRRGSS